MSDEYSYRDGWGLQFPHPSQPKPQMKPSENIKNCKCGNRTYGENPCLVCYLLKQRGM